jgi:myosin heavy subunit
MEYIDQSNDLVKLYDQNKEIDIAKVLQDRYRNGRYATKCGCNILVVTGEQKADSDAYSAAGQQKQESNEYPELPPHILQVASDAFYKMIAQNQDQTVFFL